jgi:hypothetical protein
MESQLFDAARSEHIRASGLLLGAALILSSFLLSTALVQDFCRAWSPPVAGEINILVRAG